MNYGFHLATAGAITGMRRLDTVANNLANATTVGFKADMLSLSARQPENLERAGVYSDTNTMLDALGGGSLFHPSTMDLRQGSVRDTGSQLDIALEGEGFLMLEMPKNSRGSKDALLTRAGALARDPEGRLVLAATGAAILDTKGSPIVLDSDDPNVAIDTKGRVTQSGTDVARIAVVVPEDLAKLRKEGRDAMRLAGGRVNKAPDATAVRQKALEESVVDPVATLAELVSVSRGIEFSTRMMQSHDQATGRLLDTFGRFS